MAIYVAGGVVTSAAETAIFWLLLDHGLQKVAYFIASGIAFVLNFGWHTRFTFPTKGFSWRKFFSYFLLKLLSFGIRNMLYALLFRWVGPWASYAATFTVGFFTYVGARWLFTGEPIRNILADMRRMTVVAFRHLTLA